LANSYFEDCHFCTPGKEPVIKINNIPVFNLHIEFTPIGLITNNLTAEIFRRGSQSHNYLQVTFAALCGFFASFAFKQVF
jgi:hypothetical protein